MPDKALVAGINHYKKISDLRGCLNDVESIRRTLMKSFGFLGDNIHTLADQQVKKNELRRQWKWLLDGASAGDRIVFHFSGHGSYTADDDADESDGVDELLCLYDMSWDRRDSYLLDDELREWTGEVPAGVLLTVILDCCHSGTATRMVVPFRSTRSLELPSAKLPLVDVQTSLARQAGARALRSVTASDAQIAEAVDQILSPARVDLARDSVLVRFVAPPPEVMARLDRSGVRNSFRALANQREPASMNHVLWSGSRSDQTSADAYIDGDFHGAFTYHFCDVIRRAAGTLDHQDAIRQTRGRLEQARFSQIPQLEPESTTGPLLQGAPASSPRPGDAPPQNQQVVELLQQLVSLLQDSGLRDSLMPVAPSGVQGLVYVHGICEHHAGYSDSWWGSLAQHLSPSTRSTLDGNRHEVLWSEHVTPTRVTERTVLSRAAVAEQQILTQQLREVLRDRASRQVSNALEREPRSREATRAVTQLPRALFGIPGLDCVDDFIKYLVSDVIREAVIGEFRSVIEPMLRRGESVEVISHSWGTVVAYEALCALENKSFEGQVHTLFTVGSALSIGLVQDRMRPGDGRRPSLVRRWINLDAQGDIVGGSLLGLPFDIDDEYLGLAPTGCASFGWPLDLYSPTCAHSSYFHQDNVAVNRDIFSRGIERA